MGKRSVAPRGPIDWSDVRRRMEASSRDLSGDANRSPERERDTLEARARELARPLGKPRESNALEVIRFALADETYAIETRYVMAAFRLTELCPIPGAQRPIFGVAAWRGELLTILDLRPLFGASVVALNDLARVLVLGEERAVCGVLADAVRDLVTVPESQLVEAVHAVTANRALFRGMTRDAMLVLDGKTLLESYAGRNRGG